MNQNEKQEEPVNQARKFLMESFQLPTGIVFEPYEEDTTYGKAIVYPFERGYGTTIANALRRTLISSISGFAVTAIKIISYDQDGTPHIISNSFEPIPEVYEDTVDIIANLKKLNIQLNNEEYKTIRSISIEGAQEVTGAALASDTLVVFNPDSYLFRTMDGAKLDIDLQIEFGRGYVPAETRQVAEEIGVIPLDAIFSPIRKVSFNITNTRVGGRSDYESIELEIWTNGTIPPITALGEAAKFLKDCLAIFINFSEDSLDELPNNNLEALQLQKLKQAPIDDLELSARTSNCLVSIDVKTIGELIQKKESEIVNIKNFGRKSLNEIKEKMQEYNLSFQSEDESET